jgi:hypothetical protein
LYNSAPYRSSLMFPSRWTFLWTLWF